MTGPPPALAAFFDAMVPMLEWRGGPDEVESQLGPSPSGTHRLGFYGVLARRNRFIALRQVCPATRAAALAFKPPIWRDLVQRYSRRYPPDHPDPNRFAGRLVDFLGEESVKAGWPEYLQEICDFEVSSWEVGAFEFEPSYADPGLDRTLRVRRYTHDIPSYVSRVRGAEDVSAPEAKPVCVLIYRDVHSGFPRFFFPTPLGLVAVARRAGRQLELAGASAAEVASAEADLVRHGILVEKPID